MSTPSDAITSTATAVMRALRGRLGFLRAGDGRSAGSLVITGLPMTELRSAKGESATFRENGSGLVGVGEVPDGDGTLGGARNTGGGVKTRCGAASSDERASSALSVTLG